MKTEPLIDEQTKEAYLDSLYPCRSCPPVEKDSSSYLTSLSQKAFQTSSEKGFWKGPYEDAAGERVALAIPTKLMLIVDEVTEALRIHRGFDSNAEATKALSGPPDDREAIYLVMAREEKDRREFIGELADVIIRTLDLAGSLDADIGAAVEHKMVQNDQRPYRHNKFY